MQQLELGGAVKNDLWITDVDEVPDPSPLPNLPGFHVLVRPVSVKSITKGGIFIPDSTRDDMSYLTTVGQVLALGDLAYKEVDKFPNGAWCNKGDLMFRLNKYGEALECYENALDLNPRYAIAWNNKGTTLARLGRYDEAKICQDMATRLKPKYAAAWVNKGEILAKMGKRNEAIACYKRAKKLVAA